MKFRSVVFAVALAQMFAGPAWCRSAHPAQIVDLSARWAGYWNAKNLDAVMKLYAPQPVFLPTVGPRWSGLAAIRKNFAGVLALYSPDIALHSIRCEVSGTLAYDSGSYDETIVPVKGGKAIHVTGNYIFLFQRQKNGAWKILEQSWTESEPVKL